jgi:hypothetical protein
VGVPFHRDHPEWEPVSAIRTGDERYLFEWKYTDDEQTRFFYTRYDRSTGQESEIDRIVFLDGYGLTAISSEEIPPPLRDLLERVVGYAARPYEQTMSTAVHVVLRGENGLRGRYYHQPVDYVSAEDVGLVVVPGIAGAEEWCALCADGALFSIPASGGKVRTQWLPRLPEGYAYTGFCFYERKVVAAWERLRFTEVGDAGVYIGPRSSGR